jgi:type I restriction enzyme, S subunit
MTIQEIPDGWSRSRLTDVGECQGGLTYAPEDVVTTGGTLVLRSSNIGNGKLQFNDNVYVKSNIPERMRLREGDILLCVRNGSRGLIGKCALIDKEVEGESFGAFMAVVRTRKPKFVYQLLQTTDFKRQVHRNLGATINQITNTDFSSFVFVVPPEAEQEKIAAILESWDKSIDWLETLVAAKQRRKHGLMQQLLTGKTRFRDFKREPWRPAYVGSLFEERDRYVKWSDNEAYRFASIRRRSGGLFDRGTFYGREVKTKVLKLIKAGDFVISKRQVVHGAWAMVTKPFDGFGVSDEYDVLVNRDPNMLDMRFFNYLSQTRKLWHMAYLASNGVHIEKLIFDFDDFAKEKVRIPPTVEEQTRIVDVLVGCDREIELLQEQLEALKVQKRGLIQKLLTGEIRVKVPKEN